MLAKGIQYRRASSTVCDIKPTSRGHGARWSAGCGGKVLHLESDPSRKFSDGACSTITLVGPPSIDTPTSTPLALACVRVL